MERELEKKVFLLNKYVSNEEMEKSVKKYIEMLKNKYTNAVITKEFYKGQNILVRATLIENKTINLKEKDTEREIDDWYIRQRGER